MNLLIQPSNFSISNIFFLDTKENTIMNGNFIKFIYSTELITLNGLFIDFAILETDQKMYNGKQYLFFPKNSNEENDKKIIVFERIESELLDLFIEFQLSKKNREILNKNKIHTIHKQLKNGMIKYYNYSDNISVHPKYYMKISGIWETATEIGLTYKLIQY
jgi:hypothetical protein